jgi:hypothetical protein
MVVAAILDYELDILAFCGPAAVTTLTNISSTFNIHHSYFNGKSVKCE